MSAGPVASASYGAPAMYGTGGYGMPMPSMYGTGYGMPATISAPIGTMQAPMMGAPTMMMSATIPGVHPDFPQFGPAQPYPTVVTPQDELLLRQLQSLGHTAGMDGLPGYPYIGAPYIGVYSAQNDAYGEAPAEEPAYNADEDEVRGTQV